MTDLRKAKLHKDWVRPGMSPEEARPIKVRRMTIALDKVPGGCWNWTQSLNTHGYGIVWFGGKMLLAHREAYELFIGPIPAGQWVCHTCDNRRCCNPKHLFLGTVLDNNRDTSQKGRFWNSAPNYRFCKHGHEFTAENTRVDKRGERRCRACDRERQRRYKRRLRAESFPSQHSYKPTT